MREQPVAVHRGVPVEAAEERRVQAARPVELAGALHDMSRPIRKLAADARQRERREPPGARRVESHGASLYR